MNKSILVAATIAGTGLGNLFAGDAVGRPNIIFILTDDQSSIPIQTKASTQSRPFGFNGDAYVHTPIIDGLAKNGMIFPNAYVSSTISAASRYSILTGRYAGRCEGTEYLRLFPTGKFGRIENDIELEYTKDNLPRLLQKAGYRTGFVGKSHVVDHRFLEIGKLNTNGFIPYAKGDDPKNSSVNAAMINNHNLWANKIKEYGFDYANAIYPGNLKELNNDSLNVHNVEWKNKAALDFIDQAGSEPFFLYYSETIPHGPAPWTLENGKFTKGLESNPKFTSSGYVDNDYAYLPSRRSILNEINSMPDKDIKASWLRWFDYSIGALIQKLKDKNLLDNTLIIITSDHGAFNHGKTSLYEGGVRVPLMMYWPKGIKAGTQYDELVQNIDFTPTLLDLAGVQTSSKVDGVSLKNVLSGTQIDPVHDYLYFELGYARAVLTKDWKYIAVRYDAETQKKIDNGVRFPSFIAGETMPFPYYLRNSSLGYYAATNNPHYFESDQLFDMKSDPTELVNVYSSNMTKANELKYNLTKTLQTFEGRPYGDFFDGTNYTQIHKKTSVTEIKIFPNPTKGEFVILNQDLKSRSKYEVYNFKGKLILKNDIHDRSTIVSLKKYPTGNYIIKVYNLNTVLTENLILI